MKVCREDFYELYWNVYGCFIGLGVLVGYTKRYEELENTYLYLKDIRRIYGDLDQVDLDDTKMRTIYDSIKNICEMLGDKGLNETNNYDYYRYTKILNIIDKYKGE